MREREPRIDLSGIVPRSEPALVAVMSRIQDATLRLSKACNDADEIGNRVFGAAPTLTSGMSQGGPAQDGMMSALYAATDALHERITALDSAIQRLNQL
jgi:hypothetical protein